MQREGRRTLFPWTVVEGNWWQLHQRCYSCWKHQRYSSQVSVCTPRWPPENALLVSLTQLHGKHMLWRPLRQTSADIGRHRQTSADYDCTVVPDVTDTAAWEARALAAIAADIRRLRLHCGVWCWQDLWCDMMWPLSLLMKCSDAEGGPQNFVPVEGNWWQLHQRCYSH